MHPSPALVRIVLACVALAGAALAAWPDGPAEAQRTPDPAGGGDIAAGRYVIGFDPERSEAEARALADRFGLGSDLWIGPIGALAVVAPGGEIAPEVLAAIGREPGVRYVEPDQVATALEEPNDTHYNLQWAPPLMGAEEAWDETTGDPGVAVAILDTGVDLQHPDLTGKFTSYGYDFVNSDSNPDDDNGHGTHVGGIVGAKTDNSLGVASIGWDTKLMAIKVLNASGSGNHSWIAAGITAAADNGADVINMSLGGPSGSTPLLNAVNYAHNAGVLVVASSGNSGNSNPTYPAAYSNVVAVGATNQSDVRASFSSYGTWLDITAPGVSIYSSWCCTGSGGGTPAPYVYASGTSMSAPNLSGVAALILAANPNLSNSQMRDILEDSAVDRGTPGPDIYYGHGRVDAEAAVGTAAAGGPTATPTPSPTPTPIIVVLNPVADSVVSAGAPDVNFGTLPKLMTSASPAHNAYLRFDAGSVSGTVLDATLRLYAITGSTVGYTVHGVADTTWGETTITYNNAPTVGAPGGSSGSFSGGSWTSANATSLVSGGGLVSLAATSADPGLVTLASRELSGFVPELVVTYFGSSPPTATPPTGPTATATSPPTSTSTPLPTATNTPLPTATNTPLPTATNTPLPTATNTPSGPTPTASPTPATFTFPVQADAYVLAALPNGNFGTEIRLRTDSQPVERSFLRFDVQGLPAGASSATLKVYALTGSSAGIGAHVASTSAWGETTITFNNSPGFGTAIANSGSFGGGSWVSLDVTSAIAGNGLVTFVLNGNDPTLTAFAARELSGLGAELVVVSP